MSKNISISEEQAAQAWDWLRTYALTHTNRHADHAVLLWTQAARDQKELRELMAIMHGDGGHYMSEHGTKKAVADAQAKYYAILTKIDAWATSMDMIALALQGISSCSTCDVCRNVAVKAAAKIKEESKT